MRSRAAKAVSTFAIAVGALGLTASSAVASGMSDTAPAPAPHPLTVTIGTRQPVGPLDRRHGDSAIAREVWNLQYPTLAVLDPKTLTPMPGIAAAWTPTADGRGWVYKLRTKLAWSDGKPVTAADVVYSLDHARRDRWPGTDGAFDRLTARAVNEHTVEITSRDAKAFRPGLLLPVVPEHIYAADDDLGTDVTKLGVADGTWHVTAVDRDSVQLDATAGAGGPAVQRIVLRHYPNADALIAALDHGQVDAVSDVPAADVGKLAALPNVTVVHAGDGTKYVLRFARFPVGFLPAASEAIDRDDLVAQAVHGVGTPATDAAEPEAARTELSTIERDGSAEPTIMIPSDPTGARVAQLVRADLAAAGLHTRAVAANTATPNLTIERVPADAPITEAVDLFQPDTLQAFRSDHVTGWLPEPQEGGLVVFGPTVAQYGALNAARMPPAESSSNGVYALGAVIVLALCGALYWIVSRVRRRYVSAEENDVSS